MFLRESSVEGGFTAKAPGHSIFTQAEIIEVVKEMIKDAGKCRFGPPDFPELIRLHVVKNFG